VFAQDTAGVGLVLRMSSLQLLRVVVAVNARVKAVMSPRHVSVLRRTERWPFNLNVAPAGQFCGRRWANVENTAVRV
jgi:hypothetical protein